MKLPSWLGWQCFLLLTLPAAFHIAAKHLKKSQKYFSRVLASVLQLVLRGMHAELPPMDVLVLQGAMFPPLQ